MHHSVFSEINIQSYTHDSIEDAHTALQLYKEHQKLKEVGQDKVGFFLSSFYPSNLALCLYVFFWILFFSIPFLHSRSIGIVF